MDNRRIDDLILEFLHFQNKTQEFETTQDIGYKN
jgi:hypothetical protein